jgi:FlaA1/EpsC-like NDP-sugar epimerase
MMEELESIATRREQSLFMEDLDRHRDTLRATYENRRVAIIGAAGSVGSAVAKQVLQFGPAAITLLDLSENNLTELVRDLRSTDGCRIPTDFAFLPIGLGSVECTRYFREVRPFDVVFNLSAIKHVRSEKDVYSLIRMLDTNVVFPDEFLRDLPYALRKFFSVSSDKAANPANLMGASKMVMEEVLLLHSERHPSSSARFANVAFSDGSLPFGFLRRMDKNQPLSAPRDIRRYFISHEEAGQLCILSAGTGGNREVFFPLLGAELHAMTFSEIALRLLEKRGYEPVVCASENEARMKAAELIPRKQWPCYFFDSDTSGEKDLEEFYTTRDCLDLKRFRKIGVIERDRDASRSRNAREFIDFAARVKQDPRIGKPEIIEAFRKAVPELHHQETGKNLDQKM